MSARDDILMRVRRNQPAALPLPTIPTFPSPPGTPVERFRAGVIRMGGRIAEPPADGDYTALVARLFPEARIVCSATPEYRGNRDLAEVGAPRELDDVDVWIVRAVFGVAETGSVWLTSAEFGVSALGFLAQHLVVLLDPQRIVEDLHAAYRERTHFDADYGVFMTGPSATADIEGVLIHGAQGIRSLSVILTPRGG